MFVRGCLPVFIITATVNDDQALDIHKAIHQASEEPEAGVSVQVKASEEVVVRGKCKFCKKNVTTEHLRLIDQEPPYSELCALNFGHFFVLF